MKKAISKSILLGVTGGIAAYKAAELVRLLVKSDIDVQVAMTSAATQFVTPVTFQALSGRRVFIDQWDSTIENNMPHINLTRHSQAILIAPASADFLAKLASGLADDLLSTLCLARDCPLFVAPAMNKQMWEKPATQRNITQLRQDHVIVLGPDNGEQACGEFGKGRMLEPEAIIEAINIHFQPKLLPNKKVVVTAGPTFEAIDAVRGITNLSSGKMGYAVAQAAAEAGAEVILISGPTALATPNGVQRINITSAAEMLTAVDNEIKNAHFFISVAAIADYTPTHPVKNKMKKAYKPLTIELKPTVDILAHVAGFLDAPFCVGFAAESESLLEYAEAKRKKKNIPLIAANLVQNAIGQEENELILIDSNGNHPLGKGTKISQARALIKHMAHLHSPK